MLINLKSEMRFAYDGSNLISESAICNLESVIQTNTSWFVWGVDLSGTLQGAGGIGGLLSVTRNGVTYYPYVDANGNITDYVDVNGAVVAHYEFDPYGGISAKGGALADAMSYRFSTKYLDGETGLYYYGYRHYNPQIGRWLSSDPLGEEAFRTLQPGYVESRYSHGGVLANLYLFVSNNAILLVDPFGDCGAAILISRVAQQWGPWIARGLAAAGTYIIYESSRIVRETWEEYEEKCGKCAKAGTRMEQYMETQTKLGLAGTCMCSWGPTTTAFGTCSLAVGRIDCILKSCYDVNAKCGMCVWVSIN